MCSVICQRRRDCRQHAPNRSQQPDRTDRTAIGPDTRERETGTQIRKSKQEKGKGMIRYNVCSPFLYSHLSLNLSPSSRFSPWYLIVQNPFGLGRRDLALQRSESMQGILINERHVKNNRRLNCGDATDCYGRG